VKESGRERKEKKRKRGEVREVETCPPSIPASPVIQTG